MAEAALELMTVEELLRWDDRSDRRYQLIRGAVVMMAPATRRHGVLASRVGRAVGARLRAPCEVQSEAGILLPDSRHDFYVADLAVSCSPLGSEQWCPDPILVVEVLSPSTEDEVRHEKLPNYRRLPSLRHILLVSSEAVLIEHWRRPSLAWNREALRGGALLRLEALGIELPVDEIYAGLELAPGSP
jgi:Uma2 family endonuclease